MLTLNTSYELSASHQLSATAYVRHARSATLNGDLNDDYDPPTVTEAGVENRTQHAAARRGPGAAVHAQAAGQQLTLGVSVDRSRSDFEQTEAEGDLDATRAVVPTDVAEVDALIHGRSRTTSLYVHDLISLQPNLQLTLSGRYNDTRVSTVDDGRILLGLPTTLDGEGRYRKFNPAAGLTWQASPTLTLFGSLSQGNRAPSPIELGCSDPANACVLPNALQSDPPLKQVVSRTLEIGARGKFAPQLQWNAALFRTVNSDDLLFISNGLAAGYFTNFGRTQRQGFELGLSQQYSSFGWSASYSYLRATYQSSACIVAEGNSTRRDQRRLHRRRRDRDAPGQPHPRPAAAQLQVRRRLAAAPRAGTSARSCAPTRASSCAATRTTRTSPTASTSTAAAGSAASRWST